MGKKKEKEKERRGKRLLDARGALTDTWPAKPNTVCFARFIPGHGAPSPTRSTGGWGQSGKRPFPTSGPVPETLLLQIS